MSKKPKAKSGDAKSSASAPASKAATGGGEARGYTVLARRYRSREFDELVGQEAIAQTLQNAIAQGRVAHAYLFTGTRGVGKTSMARLFAKALNVTDDLDESEGIAAAILRGDDMDVIEIDGASNRGIDGARDLIAAAGIAPARCRHKIYIIDEVHMLTTAAFNALLKTMEEPPSHVKFILCTTEAHAVPATIQSRCQRFDFRSIPAARIAAHLRSVLELEAVAFDDQAVMQVARLANGSMRDGLSLLDRLIAGVDVGGSLDAALLERMLGLPDQSLVLAIFDAIADADAGAALAATDQLLQRGQTLEQAIDTFVDHLRALMLVVACGADSDLVERSGESRDATVAQATRFDAVGIVHMIALCEATSRSVRISGAGRALLDALVVRLSMASHLASIPALLGGRLAPPEEKKKAVTSVEARDSASTRVTPMAATVRPPAQIAAPASSPPVRASVMVPPLHESAPVRDAAPSTVDALWESVRAHAADAPRDDALVADLEAVSLDDATLRLRAIADELTMRRALAGSASRVADLVRRATGLAVTVIIDATADDDDSRSRGGVGTSTASGPASAAALAEAAAHPLVREAATLFEARVVGIRPTAPTPESTPENAPENTPEHTQDDD